MKLKKLLLPIASAASVAAVVAPVVTSCGGSVTIDGSKIYIPKSAKAVYDQAHQTTGYYNRADATKLYFDDVANEPNVFGEDIMHVISSSIYYLRAYYEYLEMGFNAKIKLNYSDVTVNTEKDQSKTLSFKVKGSARLELLVPPTVNASGMQGWWDIKSFSFEASHLPYLAYAESGDFDWQFYCSVYESTLPEGASLKAKADGYIFEGADNVVFFDNKEYVFNKNTDWDKISIDAQKLARDVFPVVGNVTSSYHMGNILCYES